MALMTVAEVKAFIRETSTTYDTLIATYIPIIENDICTYCNNWFQDPVIYRESGSGIAFVRGDTDTTDSEADSITDDAAEFSSQPTGAGFRGGMDIAVDGSGSNYGIYELAGVSSGTLTLTSTGVLESLDQDSIYRSMGKVRISRINWPEQLKPIAAKMIWYQVDTNKPTGAQAERIDDYSITFAGSNQYPAQLLEGLNQYRYVRTH